LFDGEEAGTKEATVVHAGIQGGGRASLQSGRPHRSAGRAGQRGLNRCGHGSHRMKARTSMNEA
jgi:hypothetical protein